LYPVKDQYKTGTTKKPVISDKALDDLNEFFYDVALNSPSNLKGVTKFDL